MTETMRQAADRAFKPLAEMNREELVEVVAQVVEEDLNSIKNKLDDIEKRFDAMDARFNHLEELIAES